MQNLNVTLIQTDLLWEDREANLDRFGRLLDLVSASTDLILLPETFNTGFSINPATCAESMTGPSVGFLCAQAAKHNAVVMATLLTGEQGNFYNRTVCARPDGTIQAYDKRHLFRLSEEVGLLRAGSRKVVFDVKGWKIAPVTCFDLRFPVWCRNVWNDGTYGYDLLVCLANWPASRSHIWKTLLTARAIENISYAVGVNRIGTDGHGTRHTGDSMAVDPKGNILFAAGEGTETVQTVTLSAGDLNLFRESFTIGMDWDPFTINI